ncbi:hypothetical protein V6N12_004396 [Hibiscus sabdariffa]|uniref:Disease resistance R13L4/SHOC-2-like LRR domain-containing protein n=1 Tax=Hibiscus sabdariffa TaxID=183260 RepID=A0ABR2CLC4_9ROSI
MEYWKLVWVFLVAFLLYESEGCWEHEKAALLQLKPLFAHILDVRLDWVDGNCCQWKRVDCNSSTGRVTRLFLNLSYPDYAQAAQDKGHRPRHLNASLFLSFEELKSLYLSGNSITGFVDNQGIKRTSKPNKLETLDLSGNILGNTILSHLGGFTSLKTLYLESCELKGTLDILELDYLKNLKELHLGGNEIQSLGSLFQEKGQLKLAKLEVLGLRSNSFNNSIFSSLVSLSNLKSLDIESNRLEGPIPIEELNALSNLEKLYMGYNAVNDFVPSQGNETEIRLMKLEVLGLSENHFNSSILSSLGSLSNLKFLSLEGYNLQGSIDLRGKLGLHALKSLEELYLSCGTVCDLPLQSLDIFPSLKTLSLDSFRFEGTMITQRWQNLTSLKELRLRSSSLTSNIIQDIGALASLKKLVISYCEVHVGLNLNGWQKLTSLEELELESPSLPSNLFQLIGTLTSLKTMLLQNLELNGSLNLQEWQNLTSLKELTVFGSSFPSNFFQDFGILTSLKYVNVHGCEINGSLNSNEGQKNSKLEELELEDSSLHSNFIQDIGTLTSLKKLKVFGCEFYGNLNLQGFCELRQLQMLTINNNNWNASLPECFSNFTSLKYLDLSANQFFGNIYHLKTLTSLEYLDLSSNKFSGNISPLKALTSLQKLKLSYNSFEVPSSLAPLFNLSKLRTLYADNNSIYAETEMHSLAPTFQLRSISLSCSGGGGSFPHFLHHQHELQDVDLSNIYFEGDEFPNWLLENNKELKKLNLSSCSLSGHFQLPSSPLWGLTYLDLSNNSLDGNIPDDIGGKLPSLIFLNMWNNSFGGGIPDSIGDMNSLQFLDLSDNKLSGGMPLRLPMALKILYVNNNQLSGDIPSSMGNMSYLLTLDLSNNKLFGGLPRRMGRMSSLEVLMIANNHLQGPIPMDFCQLNQNLELLDLSANDISGSLPSCFSSLSLTHVYLSRNKLKGPLTNVFNSSSLVTLDLSNNHLTGNIPKWIDKLYQLNYLLLNSNHFEGGIPVQLCNLYRLRLIDVSNNNLSGTIPPCMVITTLSSDLHAYSNPFSSYNYSRSFSADVPIEFRMKHSSYFYQGIVLTYLSGIDLSCNKLTGEIPHQVDYFRNIINLNLSHNCLTGPIPPALAELRQIESLDLSYNNLSGKIPSKLVGALPFLSSFSVAYNNLSGTTPARTGQFATFEESSYVGNPFLCGEPLTNNCSTQESSLSRPNHAADDGFMDMRAFYASFFVAYIMVLLTIATVLYINPYWRRAWLYYTEAGMTSCYYFVVDNILPRRFR